MIDFSIIFQSFNFYRVTLFEEAGSLCAVPERYAYLFEFWIPTHLLKSVGESVHLFLNYDILKSGMQTSTR